MRKKILVYTSVMLISVSSLFGCTASNANVTGDSSVQATEKETTTKQTDTVQSNNSSSNTEQSDSDETEVEVEGISTLANVSEVLSEGYDEEDSTKILVSDTATSTNDVTVLKSTEKNTIYLNDDSVKSSVSGVTVSGTTATITMPGTYIVTGTLADGQIVVDCEEKGTVQIVFNNASISNSKNSPVYIKNAKKVLMVLAENSENTLSDATEYTYENVEDEEPSACLFSKDDLVISGSGSLNISGNFKNGITCKDTLKITGGTITVNAVNNAIKVNDCLLISDGDFYITADGDGLKCENTKDEALGYIDITGGNFEIETEEDAISASSIIRISDGTFQIVTAGGAVNGTSQGNDAGMGGWFGQQQTTTSDETSCKGIKANAILISGGNINVDSKDDTVHANGEIQIVGGSITLASGDDGIHADGALTIDDGKINITDSYEGLESPDMTINGGEIYIKADDDGTNAAGGSVSGTQSNNMRPGGMMSTSTGTMTINGGYIYMNAAGDGLDANGNLTMNGGTVIVEGPTNDGNTAVDYDGSFIINGGILVASGSSGMVEGVTSSSQQNSAIIYFGSSISAGTNAAVLDSEGNVVMAFTPTKTSECMIVTSDKFVQGETYTVKTGGSVSAEEKDGLCTEGTYSGGTELSTFTITSSVTTAGNGGGMNGGFGGGQMGGNQMQRPR